MKNLLIVVDYQTDFVTGSLGFPEAEEIESLIAQKISEYRACGGDIAFTLDSHDESYPGTQEGKKLPVPHCYRGTGGWELYGRVRELVREDDMCFFKPAFGSAELFDLLRVSDYERVELVGLVSSICVISNAVLAKTALPEAEIVVDASCTAGADKKLHDSALDIMAGLQITVTGR